MSTLEEKLGHHAPTHDDVARRTYASLQCSRGFQAEDSTTDTGLRIVSIATMGTRSYWAHNGQGKWNAGGAVYERIREEAAP